MRSKDNLKKVNSRKRDLMFRKFAGSNLLLICKQKHA